ncbi:Alpha-mannosyltransferase [uncultured Caudovirales phage]|uniref:Alpha-mannosyltransferase n=1 Tax=uncultured Caudovirales phage TaxID=2100421 RepID=A0A6J5MDG2_9CAUD|nr:Alpha-mannosyltransferase [uncultured Caudovirales phage]
MNRGYFFIAFGTQYIEELKMLVNTLRKVGDTLPISVLTSEQDADYCKSLNIFDKIVIYDFNNELSLRTNTSFEKYGAVPKILMLKLTPYEETIFVDSDVLCQYNPEHVWELMREKKSSSMYSGSGIFSRLAFRI